MSKFILPTILLSYIVAIVASSVAQERILGGDDANIEDFPYHVAVQVEVDGELYQLCGGSILNAYTVLTAAHCVDWDANFYIRAGTANRSSGGQLIRASSILHPRFNKPTIENDLAIMKLQSSLLFNDQVKPIGLPGAYSDVPAGTVMNVTGWGALYDGGPSPERLQIVQKPIFDRNDCYVIHQGYSAVIDVRSICAGDTEHSACGGDSGGPLVLDNVLIGAVSWGISPCGESGFPTVYSRVSYFLDFINENL